MIKTISDGVIKINDRSFMEFCSALRGNDVIDKRTNQVVPKFILFWKGFTIARIKEMYFVERKKD